ncbi:hypothetical protein BT96DRAFT_544948, partial [Gymnopus androsaceus JB14]
MAAPIYPLTLSQHLDIIRNDSFTELWRKFADSVQPNLKDNNLSLFIMDLDDSEQVIALRLCLLVYTITNGKEIPKELQLKAALASIDRDTLVIAGTGFGKTHIMALLQLLEKSNSNRVFITISPLKRLQETQTEAFLNKYRIPTVAINQDTCKTKEFWKDNIHNRQKNASQAGTSRHLIITAEQLFKSPEGHFTKLAVLLREHSFCCRIAHINIDEIHFTHFAGEDRFGIPAFRPAWGRLLELKMRLPKTVRYHGFTATCPPHVQHTIEQTLLGSDYLLFKHCVNRPGIIYARHCVVGSFDVLDNYLCCIRTPFPVNGTLHDQPRVLIFFDSNTLTRRAAKFLRLHAPPQFQGTDFAMHYYGSMSPDYLKKAH